MADYQQALQELMRKRQMAQPSPEDMAANDKQNQLGILLNQLSKSQAMMGNIGGKPTESTGVDFQDYGKLASAQMAQKNLLANQNFDQGLQQQQAGMQADKFAQDQQAQAAMVARQPMMDARALAEQKLKERLTNSQIGENEAKTAELKNKAMNGDTTAAKDFNEALRVEKLKQFVNSPGAKDPAQLAAANSVIERYQSATQRKDPNLKANSEVDYRVKELKKNTNEIRKMITEKGTFEAFGPQSDLIDSKLYQIAVDYAKLVDPESVAREGEVASAKKYMLNIKGMTGGLLTRNKTALDLLDQFESDVNSRGEQFKSSFGGQNSNPVSNTSAKPKTVSQNGITYTLNEATGAYE